MNSLADVVRPDSKHFLGKQFKVKMSLSKFLQLRFNLILMSILPMWCARGYIWLLAKLYFFWHPSQVKRIRKNIAIALRDRTPSEVKKITRGVIKGTIHHYQEKMANGFLDNVRLKKFLLSNVTFDGYEKVLREALDERRGVIIASGHYGGIEFLARYLALRKYPASAMVKFTTEKLRETMVPRGERDGLIVVVPDDKTNVMREISKVLAENRVFVTQCDESEAWHADRSKTIEFLGKTVHPDRMLEVLRRRTGAVLLVGLLMRKEKRKYQLILHRVPDDESVPANIRALKLFERYVSEYPEQWYEWKKYHKIPNASSTNS